MERDKKEKRSEFVNSKPKAEFITNARERTNIRNQYEQLYIYPYLICQNLSKLHEMDPTNL